MAIAADIVPRGPVTAKLFFYDPPSDGSVPFNYVDAPPEGEPQRNFGDAAHDVTISDIRGHEADFANLDRDAFAVIQNVPVSAEKEFIDDESIKTNYYPEVEALLLKHVPGATKVIFFDHTIRRADPNASRNPVQKVHIDQTAASAAKRVERHAASKAEAAALLAGRYRIINVWRPLNAAPVESFPLAFASSATLADGDVVPVEHRYSHGYIGETAGIRHNAKQQWYYLSGITGDERLLLECFDSEALRSGSAVQGGRAAHTAFADPRSREGAVGRESIEVRALVFGP